MPGIHYTTAVAANVSVGGTTVTVTQPPEFNFYISGAESMPALATEGDRLLQDNRWAYTFFDGQWHLDHDPYQELLSKLEDVRGELEKQTPAAVALLNKL